MGNKKHALPSARLAEHNPDTDAQVLSKELGERGPVKGAPFAPSAKTKIALSAKRKVPAILQGPQTPTRIVVKGGPPVLQAAQDSSGEKTS